VSTLGDRRSRVDRRRTLSLYTLSACLANLVPEYVQLFLPSVRPSVQCIATGSCLYSSPRCFCRGVHGRGFGTGIIMQFEGAGPSTV
jgi:hypothetical protein